MFGSNKKNNETGKTISIATTHSLNSIVQGTSLEGKAKAGSDFRVDGSIKGELHCDAKVIIGPTGLVEGTVKCQNAVIEGRFEGTLLVDELLNIRETAKVIGDVSYGKLIVQSGAVISGSYKVGNAISNGLPKSSSEAQKIVSAKSTETKDIAGKTHEHTAEKAN